MCLLAGFWGLLAKQIIIAAADGPSYMQTILEFWDCDYGVTLATATPDQLESLRRDVSAQHRKLKCLCLPCCEGAAGACLAKIARAIIAQIAAVSNRSCSTSIQELHWTASTWNTWADSTVPNGPGTAATVMPPMESIGSLTQAVAWLIAELKRLQQPSSSASSKCPTSLCKAWKPFTACLGRS